jgi:hypothetical protein
MHKYTRTEIRFLETKIAGRGYAELTELFNRRFGLAQTENAIRYAAFSRGLTNGLPRAHKWTPKEVRFLKSKIAGRSFAETAELFNKHFGTSLTVEQVRAALHNRGIRNSRDCRFRPGSTPPNKGKKGVCPPGCKKGWFKPGNIPQTYVPVGTEQTNSEGYVVVKIANHPKGGFKKNWAFKHVLIWEKKNGPVPNGHVILFADRNRLNVKLSNLLMVSRSELAVMNHLGLISANKDLTKIGKTVADIKLLIADRKRGTKKGKKALGRKKRVLLDDKAEANREEYDDRKN